MFPIKKVVWFLFLGLMVTSMAWGQSLDGDLQYDDELNAPAEEINNSPIGPPPFILDFTTGPTFLTRSYVTGYLNTADSHTLPAGTWRAGVDNVASFWSYKIFGSQVDSQFLDSIFMWGLGLAKGVEVNMALPVRWYFNTQLSGSAVDLINPFSLYDSSLSLKAVYKGPYAAAGLALTQSFPVGNEKRGFGVKQFITKLMGIFSLTPFKGMSIDMNLSYYVGGDGPQKHTFAFEGVVFNIGGSYELSNGFALYGQFEYWNPVVPVNSNNDRLTASVGLKVQLTETGAVFFALGYSLKNPKLAPEFAGLTAASYKEDNYFYLMINLIEHW